MNLLIKALELACFVRGDGIEQVCNSCLNQCSSLKDEKPSSWKVFLLSNKIPLLFVFHYFENKFFSFVTLKAHLEKRTYMFFEQLSIHYLNRQRFLSHRAFILVLRASLSHYSSLKRHSFEIWFFCLNSGWQNKQSLKGKSLCPITHWDEHYLVCRWQLT